MTELPEQPVLCGAVMATCQNEPHAEGPHWSPLLAAQGLAITGAPEHEPEAIMARLCPSCRAIVNEETAAAFARLRSMRLSAPPSPVDGEGLRAALVDAIRATYYDGAEHWRLVRMSLDGGVVPTTLPDSFIDAVLDTALGETRK